MASRDQIENELTEKVSQLLSFEIEKTGSASLLVSGGSTPKNLFLKLSQAEILWDKVQISLVDERYLPDGDPNQNGTIVKELLLQNKAKTAEFFPFVLADTVEENAALLRMTTDSIKQPFTVVILGVGNDGHTASIFPDSKELDEALDPKNKEKIMITHSENLPYTRFTFTAIALLNSKQIFIHGYGNEKKSILQSAADQETALPYPIAYFINQENTPVEIYWAK